jgi:N-acetylmuramoyl-L-alanine amidase
MKLQRRSAFGWGATPAGFAACKNGLVVHYNGGNTGLAGKAHNACVSYWKQTRSFHINGRGWADIGYSFMVCPHGYVMEGRGWQRAQAAQPGGNTTWTSVTFASGPNEKPTAAQVTAFKELRAWLRGKGLAAAISYHSRFISTSCPGAILRGMVTSGALTGSPTSPPKEEDMPLSKEDIEKVAAETVDQMFHARYNRSGYTLGVTLEATHNGIAALLARDPDVDEAEVARLVLAGLPPERIAAAIPDELAEQVVTALGERLTPQEG